MTRWRLTHRPPAATSAFAVAVAGHLLLIGLLWAFLHHFCMGIRILLLDLDMGTDLKPARASAKAVLAISLALTVILGVKLW